MSDPTSSRPSHTGDALEVDERTAYVSTAISMLHERISNVVDGEVAGYIPELARVDPDQFGIAGMTVDGRHLGVGDHAVPFSIQSISKLLLYGLALEMHGRERVLERVGVAPTGESFNAIQLDAEGRQAPNPMVNAGAIAITDLVEGDDLAARLEVVMGMYERYLGRRPEIDSAVWASERATGNRNRAIAYLMASNGIIGDDVEKTLDLYFAQCSVLVTCDDLARIGATLANFGLDAVTGERVVDGEVVRDMLTLALTCGMYDYAGEWAFTVGIPAKSGVGGGILGVLPGVSGLATFSPRLDRFGNSVRGVRVFEELSSSFDLHLFDPDRPWARSAETHGRDRQGHLPAISFLLHRPHLRDESGPRP
jgi:glutaminase